MMRRDHRLPAWQKQLWRGRLLDRLKTETGRNFLTVVQAPTGYGKTILLANFAQWVDFPVCWVNVTGAERDPFEFMKLIARNLCDTFNMVNVRLPQQVMYSGSIVAGVEALQAEVSHLPPHLVIIEDLDKIEGVGIHRTIDTLLSQPWPSTRFLISIRYSLSLNTVLEHLGNDDFGALDRSDLAFTPDEIYALLSKRGYGISPDDAGQLAQVTEGSIARILTIAPVWRGGNNYESAVNRLIGDLDYDLVLFMRQTTVLPYLDAELCDKLLDRKDSINYLLQLHRMNLVQSLEAGRFEYSDNLLIHAKLALPMADKLRLYRKATQLFLERQDYFHAGSICFEIQDWSYLLRIIIEHGKTLYQRGQVKLLESWLVEMPEWLLDQQVEVMLLYGRILVNDLSNPAYALELFTRAELNYTKQKNRVGQARSWAWQSVALRAMGEPDQALRLAAASVAKLREWGESDMIAWSIRLLGLAYRATGDSQEHLAHLLEALKLYETLGDPWYIAQCHQDLGVGYAGRGDLDMAESHYQEAICAWEKMGIANGLANTINSLGVNRLLAGLPREATVQFEKALVIAEQAGIVRRQAFSLTGRGDAYLAEGQQDLALVEYAAALRLAEQVQARMLVVYIRVKTAEALYLNGLIRQALSTVDECILIAEEKRFIFEIGLACELKGKILLTQMDYAGALSLFEQAAGWFQSCFPFGVVRSYLGAACSALKGMRQQAALDHLASAIQQAQALAALLPAWKKEIEQIEPVLAHFYISPMSDDTIRHGIVFLLGRSPRYDQVHLSLIGEASLSRWSRTRQFYDRGKAAKGVEIVAYLALNGPCSKETIQEALWPDLSLKESHQWFHWSVRHLRESFYEEIITQADQLYQVNFDWVDLTAFEFLAKRIAHGAGLETRLELIALYRGPFLKGFDLGEWGIAYRENLTHRFLQQTRLASRELLDLRQPEQALNIIMLGLQQDAYQEDLYKMVGEAYEQLCLDPTGYLTWAAGMIRAEIGVEPAF